jgi:copper chaperone NosL
MGLIGDAQRGRTMYHSLLKRCVFGFLILLWLGGLGWASERKGPPKVTDKDKCPVCGMFVAKYPDWTSSVLFKDGSVAFFDGPKDMFKYLFNLKRYNPSKKKEDIEAVWVKDYYNLSFIKAGEAWFVLGSDVFGPMGHELIPMGKESEAKEFFKDHKGKRIIKFNEVSAEILTTLD